MIQAGAPPPHPVHTVAHPSPPGQPQEETPEGQSTCRGGHKTTVESQGTCG